MSQSNPTPSQRLVTELKVSAHLMLLDPGLFCVFHSPGTPLPDPATGLPGVRITRPPATPAELLSISTFNPDGWLGGEGNAALVRVSHQPAQVLVTIYQVMNSAIEAPKLQVLRLSDPAAPRQQPVVGIAGIAPSQITPPTPISPPEAVAAPPGIRQEVAAHVQRRGDLLTRLGEWMGERGSQNWIEGFAISPSRHVEPADIEYQAVLGKGWLSPWAEGGSYCGSRGMALPILGLRVRLKGDATARYDIRISATFTDGSSVGPVDGTDTVEAADLSPLEAFCVDIVPKAGFEAAVEADHPVPDAAGTPAPALPERAAVRRAGARTPPVVVAKSEAPQPVVLKREADQAAETTQRKVSPIRPAASVKPASRGATIAKAGTRGRR